VSGAWLDDSHGVSTGGLGLIAAGLGFVELVASAGVAMAGDRIGSRRSVSFGLMILLAGLGIIATSGDSRPAAIAGLLVFLTGFEFGFVSTLTLVTEAAPNARGRAIGISNACGTVARATAVVVSGQLYEAFGMTGSITLAAAAAVAALALTRLTPI
jgi:predicted MFS family arabinose efflux permease